MKAYLLVADVLGFSAIVRNLTHTGLSERLGVWVDIVKKTSHDVGIKDVQLISDTVFAQETCIQRGPERLFQFSRTLLERGMEESFPIRGAITCGEVSWDEKLIYGDAVIEAHDLERSLEWIGIAAAKSLPQVPWSWDLACSYPVPKKAGQDVESLPAVVWATPKPKDLLVLCLSGGLSESKPTVKWGQITKLTNALIFSRYVELAKQDGLQPLQPCIFHSKFPSHVSFL